MKAVLWILSILSLSVLGTWLLSQPIAKDAAASDPTYIPAYNGTSAPASVVTVAPAPVNETPPLAASTTKPPAKSRKITKRHTRAAHVPEMSVEQRTQYVAQPIPSPGTPRTNEYGLDMYVNDPTQRKNAQLVTDCARLAGMTPQDNVTKEQVILFTACFESIRLASKTTR